MKERMLTLALVELNRKYAMALSLAPEDVDEHEWAVSKLQNDLENISNLAGEPVRFDNNYSLTWGFNRYGIYRNLDEMYQVAEIVDGGF